MIDNLVGTVTDTTLDRYRKAWGDYASYCEDSGLETLTAAAVMAWRRTLVDAGYGPNTINSILSAIKSVFKAACAAGDVSIETYTQVRAVASVSVRALRDRLRPSKDVLDDNTVRRMADAIDVSTLKGMRDRAIVLTLATTGLRIDELCSLKLTDWSAAAGTVRVLGKTDRRPRTVPIGSIASRAISAWLWARDARSAWLFTSFAGKSGALVDKPITTQGAYNVVVAAARRVGVNISPHDFRRYVATKLASDNIVSAQAVLGHASIITTQRYVKRAELPSTEWLE